MAEKLTKDFRDKIKQAIKEKRVNYLRGVLQVEKLRGNMERIQWLKQEISKMQYGG